MLYEVITWITYGVLLEELEASVGTRICRRERWDVNQMGGWQGSVQNIARRQPVGTEDLRQQALDRYSAIPSFVQQEIENLRLGLDQGYSAPKSVVDLVIGQIDGIVSAPIEES